MKRDAGPPGHTSGLQRGLTESSAVLSPVPFRFLSSRFVARQSCTARTHISIICPTPVDYARRVTPRSSSVVKGFPRPVRVHGRGEVIPTIRRAIRAGRGTRPRIYDRSPRARTTDPETRARRSRSARLDPDPFRSVRASVTRADVIDDTKLMTAPRCTSCCGASRRGSRRVRSFPPAGK